MKNKVHSLLLSFLAAFLFSTVATAQDAEKLSDNFSLEGALELFKNSESPEDFEKKLNTEESQVNNLDLNEDGDIDYIRVVDNMEGDVHALVLQVPVNEDESQDIAVIEIEKTGEEDAILQIVGDEVLYGENHIVEPYEVEAKDDGRGPSVKVARLVVNVWLWPSVRFLYRPGYRVWVSPYRYRNYPRWWNPWRPRPVSVFVGYRAPYRHHYRVTTTHRVVRAHRVYTPRRRTSAVVRTRATSTRVAAPRAKRSAVGKKRSTTTVKKNRGGAVRKKTTTTRARKGRKG
jgi:hypothetical protein